MKYTICTEIWYMKWQIYLQWNKILYVYYSFRTKTCHPAYTVVTYIFIDIDYKKKYSDHLGLALGFSWIIWTIHYIFPPNLANPNVYGWPSRVYNFNSLASILWILAYAAHSKIMQQESIIYHWKHGHFWPKFTMGGIG